MDGHEYVIVAIYYFTEWVEAPSYTKITSKHVVKFLLIKLYVDTAHHINK